MAVATREMHVLFKVMVYLDVILIAGARRDGRSAVVKSVPVGNIGHRIQIDNLLPDWIDQTLRNYVGDPSQRVPLGIDIGCIADKRGATTALAIIYRRTSQRIENGNATVGKIANALVRGRNHTRNVDGVCYLHSFKIHKEKGFVFADRATQRKSVLITRVIRLWDSR